MSNEAQRLYDALSKQAREHAEQLLKYAYERDRLRNALQALYDAMPTGYGEDRALNEALAAAEKALGIEKKVSHV